MTLMMLLGIGDNGLYRPQLSDCSFSLGETPVPDVFQRRPRTQPAGGETV